MTREELAIEVACARNKGDSSASEAIVQLADERDALLKRVLDPTPYAGPAIGIDIVDRLRGIYVNSGGEYRFFSSSINQEAALLILSLRDVNAAIAQRDRALALLRDDAMWGSGCLAPFVGDGDDSKCLNDPPCWEHRRRALLAEVDG